MAVLLDQIVQKLQTIYQFDLNQLPNRFNLYVGMSVLSWLLLMTPLTSLAAGLWGDSLQVSSYYKMWTPFFNPPSSQRKLLDQFLSNSAWRYYLTFYFNSPRRFLIFHPNPYLWGNCVKVLIMGKWEKNGIGVEYQKSPWWVKIKCQVPAPYQIWNNSV